MNHLIDDIKTKEKISINKRQEIIIHLKSTNVQLEKQNNYWQSRINSLSNINNFMHSGINKL